MPGFQSAFEARHVDKGSRRSIWLMIVSLLTLPFPIAAQEGARALVSRTVENENRARPISKHYFFLSQETSARTGGRVWVEKSVQIESGLLRRLISVDGQPLPADKALSEDRRIANLVARPDEFRKANKAQNGDERSIEDLSRAIPRAFVFTYDGYAAGCTRLRFQPDPAFVPANYQQRLLTALAGTTLIKEPEDRECGLDAKVFHPLEIGFGLIGKVDENGRIHTVRTPMSDGNWLTTTISIHIAGRMFLLKSISQNHDEVRTEIKDIPPRISLAEAAEFTKR